jgi:hypothetical protein
VLLNRAYARSRVPVKASRRADALGEYGRSPAGSIDDRIGLPAANGLLQNGLSLGTRPLQLDLSANELLESRARSSRNRIVASPKIAPEPEHERHGVQHVRTRAGYPPSRARLPQHACSSSLRTQTVGSARAWLIKSSSRW